MNRTNLILARGKHTQSEIAACCNVRQQTYSHWETGRVTPPIKKILILERVLNRPKEELFPDIFNSNYEYINNLALPPTGTD